MNRPLGVPNPLDARRRFLNAALMIGASSLLSAHARAAPFAPAREIDTLRVAVLLPDVNAGDERVVAARRGVDLGVEESSRTAALFGLTLVVVFDTARLSSGPLRTPLQMLARQVTAMIGGVDDESCRAVERLAEERRAVVLTLRCPWLEHVVDACDRRVFYVYPGERAIARAWAARRQTAIATDTGTSTIVVWHHTLRRFGAEQLNARFRRRFNHEMDSFAWAGWAAMKILTEATLHTRSVAPADLAHYFVLASSRFDGHKGEPLAFDPQTGELRQPLYLVGRADPSGRAVRVLTEVVTTPRTRTSHSARASCTSSDRARR